MIEKIIEWSVRNRWMVILAWAGIMAWGLYAVLHTPVDAIPDLSENQVIVFADWMGRSPQDIEDQVTYPLSVQLQGLAGVKVIRSSSEFNFSMITIIFDEKTDFYFARTRVLEKLATAQAQMPAGVTPYMAPDATALGQIFWYTVEGEGQSLDALRALQDWNIRYQLASVPGVAEVASVGGMVREYQVDVDPARLRAYDLPLGALYSAISQSNMSVGGQAIVEGGSEYLLRGVGWLSGEADLENVVVSSRGGVPLRLKDVATVQMGPAFRRSALEKNGQEVAGGVVMMRYGENPLEVTRQIKEKIRLIQAGLPAGVRVVPFYDRTRLIESAIHTVTGTLKEEMIIASIAILLILTHFRSALVVCITLPMAVLVSFIFMHALGISSNIMSLAGIAISIGILVDAAVVMVENATHQLHDTFGTSRVSGDTTELVVKSCRLVGRPIFFSVLIMLISFLPIFAFGGQEGKLSHPLAFTKSFAMVGVAIISITLVPALIPLLIRGRLRGETENPIVRSFINIYKPMLSWVINRPGFVWWLMAMILSIAMGFVGGGLWPAVALGAGVLFVVLGIRKTGWTMWIVIAAVVLTVSLMATGQAKSLPIGNGAWIGWAIFVSVAGLCILAMGLKHWRTVAVASLLATAFWADTRFTKLGSEFMPSLNEGSILDMPTTAPRVGMAQALDDVRVRDRVIQSLPEVELAVGKVGRAETATDPSPLDMVETIITLHPKEWWPKRKWRFDDALDQAAVVARQMQQDQWLGKDGLDARSWADARRAVSDTAWGEHHPELAVRAEILNTVASTAMEDFDRSARALSRQRQAEYQPEVALELTNQAAELLIAHLRELPDKAGRPALMRQPSKEEIQAIVEKAIEPHGRLIAEMPRQEGVDALLSMLVKAFQQAGIAADRDDLLVDQPGAIRSTINQAMQALGGTVDGYAARVMKELEKRRDELWVSRTEKINWELADVAPSMINTLLQQAMERAVVGTPLEGPKVDSAELAKARQRLDAPLAGELMLWHKTHEDVLRELDSELQMPGWGNAWTQPIINRVNMLATGVRTQIGVKVYGPTNTSPREAIEKIGQVSNQIAARLKTLRGAVDVVADQAVGKRYLEIQIDRENAARYGVNMSEISQAVETAMGGARITTTVEGRERFGVRLRYARDFWQTPEQIGQVLVTAQMTPAQMLDVAGSGKGVGGLNGGGSSAGGASGGGSMGTPTGGGMGATASGNAAGASQGMNAAGSDVTKMKAQSQTIQIPLSLVADIQVVDGPAMIKAENGRLRNYVTLNVRDRDIVGFVEEAKEAIRPIEASLAGTGMSIEWSGEFEHQVRARQTMMVIFPLVVVAILFLLYVTFADVMDSLLVFWAVIGALCGSLMFQAMFGFNFSVIVSIGYVAAFGMATETGVIMLVYLREAIDRRGGLAGITSLEELRKCVIEGAVHRLRPKLLTEGVAIIGLVPMLWATGTGSEIMRPMAAPVLGGLLISDEVIDLMIPVMFYWIRRKRWLKMKQQGVQADTAADLPPVNEEKSGAPVVVVAG